VDPKERAEALAAARAESLRGETVSEDLKEAADKAAASKGPDMADPEYQRLVLGPESWKYKLALETAEGGIEEHEIEVPTKFSLRDIEHRRVFDNASAYYQLVQGLLRDMRVISTDEEFLRKRSHYVDAVVQRSEVQDLGRHTISKIATYTEPWEAWITDPQNPKKKRPVTYYRPSIEHLAEGLDPALLGVIMMQIVGACNTENARRKNAVAAARQSASRPPSAVSSGSDPNSPGTDSTT
jgi:hypothetical protein